MFERMWFSVAIFLSRSDALLKPKRIHLVTHVNIQPLAHITHTTPDVQLLRTTSNMC